MPKRKVVKIYECDSDTMETVKSSEIFQNIPESSINSAMEMIKPYKKEFGKNGHFIEENEISTKLAIVREGKFVAVRNDYAGRSTMIKEYNPKDIIGLNVVFSKTQISPTLIQATASENSVVIIDLKSVLSPTYPDKRLQYSLQLNLMHAIAEDSVKDIYKIDIVAKKTIRERVLAYLFIMMKKRRSTSFNVDMDREHMAQFLDVTRSALSHELSKMCSDGLIECRRDWFKIKDACIEKYAPEEMCILDDESENPADVC